MLICLLYLVFKNIFIAVNYNIECTKNKQNSKYNAAYYSKLLYRVHTEDNKGLTTGNML